MLTIAKCRDLDYYEREVVEGREEYLSEGGASPGRWVGSLAATDGLTGPADRDALMRAFDGVHPDGFTMTEHRLKVNGFDLTLSPSKSVSLIWALGSPDDARHVEDALYAARDEVERYLEQTACFVRRGHAGAIQEPGKGFFGAVFLHRTSRLGDPGIHLHWTVFNVTEGPDGRRTALDGKALYKERYTAEAVFQATLRRELVERLGVVFDEVDRHGVAEITGISPQMRKAFSRRRAEIVAEMDRLGVHSGAGARIATLNTRKPKLTGITEERAPRRVASACPRPPLRPRPRHTHPSHAIAPSRRPRAVRRARHGGRHIRATQRRPSRRQSRRPRRHARRDHHASGHVPRRRRGRLGRARSLDDEAHPRCRTTGHRRRHPRTATISPSRPAHHRRSDRGPSVTQR